MNMRRIECILLCLFIGILSMAAQTRTVTGSVFDKADNQPVIGATIAVMSAQGTVAHGTTTDLDGKFKLEVPSGTQNLTCRFMGLYNDHDSSSNWKRQLYSLYGK